MLKAFTAWIKLNPELTGLPDAALAGHPLVLLSLAALQDAELFDDAVDATAELISASGLMMHHAQPPSRYMPLVQELVHAVWLRGPTRTQSMFLSRPCAAVICAIVRDLSCALCGYAAIWKEMGPVLLRCRCCSFARV